jgi:hypothetical protein
MKAPCKCQAEKVHLGLLATSVQVDATADIRAVANDAECLLRAAMRAIDAMSEVAGSDRAPDEVRENWWAMLYTLRAGMGAFDRLYSLAHAEAAK